MKNSILLRLSEKLYFIQLFYVLGVIQSIVLFDLYKILDVGIRSLSFYWKIWIYFK